MSGKTTKYEIHNGDTGEVTLSDTPRIYKGAEKAAPSEAPSKAPNSSKPPEDASSADSAGH